MYFLLPLRHSNILLLLPRNLYLTIDTLLTLLQQLLAMATLPLRQGIRYRVHSGWMRHLTLQLRV